MDESSEQPKKVDTLTGIPQYPKGHKRAQASTPGSPNKHPDTLGDTKKHPLSTPDKGCSLVDLRGFEPLTSALRTES